MISLRVLAMVLFHGFFYVDGAAGSTIATLPTIQESDEEAKYELSGAMASSVVVSKKQAPLTQDDFNTYCAKEFRTVYGIINKHNRFSGALSTQSKAWKVITFLKMPFFAKERGIPFSAALQDLMAVRSKTEFDCFCAHILPVWSLLRLDATDTFISDLEQKHNDFQFILISGQIVQYLQKMLDHCLTLTGQPAHPDDLKNVDLLRKKFEKISKLLPRSEIVPRKESLPTDILGGVLYLSSLEGIDAQREITPEKGQWLYCVDAVQGLYYGFSPFFKEGPKTLFEVATDHERRIKAEISAAVQDAEKWYRNEILALLQKKKIKEKKIKPGTHPLQYLADPALHTYYIKPENWTPPPNLEISDTAEEESASMLSKAEVLDPVDEWVPPSTQKEFDAYCAHIFKTVYSRMNKHVKLAPIMSTQSEYWNIAALYKAQIFVKVKGVPLSVALQDLMKEESHTSVNLATAHQIAIWNLLQPKKLDDFILDCERKDEDFYLSLIVEETLQKILKIALEFKKESNDPLSLQCAILLQQDELCSLMSRADEQLEMVSLLEKNFQKIKHLLPNSLYVDQTGKSLPYQTVLGGAMYLPGVGEESSGPQKGMALFCVDADPKLYMGYDPIFADGPKKLFDVATELEKRAKLEDPKGYFGKLIAPLKQLKLKKMEKGVHPLQYQIKREFCCFFVIPKEWEKTQAKVKPKETQLTDALMKEGNRLALEAFNSTIALEETAPPFTLEGFSDYFIQKHKKHIEDAWERYLSVNPNAKENEWNRPKNQDEYNAYCAQTRLDYLLVMNKRKSYAQKPSTKSEYWYVEMIFGISFFVKKRHYPAAFAFSDLIQDDSMTKFDDQSLHQTLNWIVLPHLTRQLFVKHCEDEDEEFFLPLIDGPTVETLGKFAKRDHERLSNLWNMEEEWQKFGHLKRCFNKIKNFVPSAQMVQQDGSFPYKVALGGNFYLPNVEEITGPGMGVNLFRVGEDSYIGSNDYFKDGPQTIDAIAKHYASQGIAICLCKRKKSSDYMLKLMAPLEKLISEGKIKGQEEGTHLLQYHVDPNTCLFMPYQEKAWQNEVIIKRFIIC